MLKVEKIDFIDKKDQVYTINKYQIESFPLNRWRRSKQSY